MAEIVVETEEEEVVQVLREGTPWHDPGYFPPPRGDGPYWIYDHDRGSIYAMVHENGHWHDCTFDGMDGKEVIAGPLSLPSQDVLDRQAEHFETVRRSIAAEIGFDPAEDVVQLETSRRHTDPRFPPQPPLPEPAPQGKRKHRKKVPPAPTPLYVAPYVAINGYYWIKMAPDWEPIFAMFHEGHWAGMTETPFMWDSSFLTTYPIVVFGPFVRPNPDVVVHRTASTLLN